MDAGDPNLGPRACSASTFPTKPALQPHFLVSLEVFCSTQAVSQLCLKHFSGWTWRAVLVIPALGYRGRRTRSSVQPELCSNFKASLCYLRPRLKTKTDNPTCLTLACILFLCFFAVKHVGSSASHGLSTLVCEMPGRPRKWLAAFTPSLTQTAEPTISAEFTALCPLVTLALHTGHDPVPLI